MPIESYPNQKIVQIHRDMPKQTKENKKPYIVAYTDAIEQASQNIKKPTSFKLYLYLLCNQDNYKFALSTQDFANKYGVSIDSAKDAVNNLISLGYLVNRGKKTYDFYEVPQNNDIEPVEEVKKSFRINGGEVVELSFTELAEKVGDKNKAEEIWRNAR